MGTCDFQQDLARVRNALEVKECYRDPCNASDSFPGLGLTRNARNAFHFAWGTQLKYNCVIKLNFRNYSGDANTGRDGGGGGDGPASRLPGMLAVVFGLNWGFQGRMSISVNLFEVSFRKKTTTTTLSYFGGGLKELRHDILSHFFDGLNNG